MNTLHQKNAYFVAVPIGNPKDFSLQAIEVLKEIEILVCENILKTKELLQRSSINDTSKKFYSLSAFVEKNQSLGDFLENKIQDQNFAFLSDAGTPLINDPGKLLLHAAEENGFTIKALSGPCAGILAYQQSGGFGLPLFLAGFPPKKNKTAFFQALKHSASFVFYESKHRILETLKFISEDMKSPDLEIILCRELTKKHEEIFKTQIHNMITLLEERNVKTAPFGEITCILKGQLNENQLSSSGDSWTLEELVSIRNSSPSDAAKSIAKRMKLSKSEVYGLFKPQS